MTTYKELNNRHVRNTSLRGVGGREGGEIIKHVLIN